MTSSDEYPVIYFLTNTGQVKMMTMFLMLSNEIDILPGEDIIHIAAHETMIVLTNVRGEVTIDDQPVIVNLEPVVTTAVGGDFILFLTVSGVVRVYYSLFGLGSDTPSFSEFTKGHKTKSDTILERLDNNQIFNDVVKISAVRDEAKVLKLNGDLLDVYGRYKSNPTREPCNHNVLDFSLSNEGFRLELTTDRHVRRAGQYSTLLDVKDIIAVSIDFYSILVSSDGRVLIGNHIVSSMTFTTIPRLRLSVK